MFGGVVILLMLGQLLHAQINLNPPNQLLPSSARVQQPSAPTGQPSTLPQPNNSGFQLPTSTPPGAVPVSQSSQFRTVSQPNYRTAQQPQPPLVGPQQPANNAIPLPGPLPGASQPATIPGAVPVAPVVAPQQNPVAQPVSDASSITPEAVMAFIQQLQAATDLEPTIKQTLITDYEAILAELKSRTETERVFKKFVVAYEAAPNATAEAKRRRENPQPQRVFFDGTLESARIETLQSYQLEIQGLAQAATDGRTSVEAAIVSSDARRKEIPQLIAQDKATITKLNEELALPPVESIDPRLRESHTLLLRAKLLALNDRVRRLEQEQRTYDAELELLPVRKEVLLAEEKFQQAKLKEVKEELGKRRENQIAEQKRVVEELVAHASPELKIRVESLLKRSDDWLQLAKQNSALRMEVDSARGELKMWTDRFKIMSDRISPESSRQVSNFNSWVGLMLRKQRNELPDIGRLAQKLHDYQTRLLATGTLILELDDWKASTALSEDSTNATTLATNSVEEFSRYSFSDQQRILVAMEHKLVDEFRVDANSYFENLFYLAETNQKTIDKVKTYRSFIDEHVLWIRSSEPISKSDFRQLWPAVKWLFDLQNWRIIPVLLIKDFQIHPWGYILVLGGFVLLLLNLKRFKIHTQVQGKVATKPNCTSFVPTAQVVVACVLLSSPLALLHLILGWRLLSNSEGNSFVEAIAMGLLVSARYFFPLEMIRQISRAGGLAENHFQWPVRSTQLLRKNLRWFIDLAIPAVAIVGIVSQFGETKWENSLGRLTYSLLMSLCFIYLLVLLHPTRGVFSDFLSRNAGGWIDRLRYIWYTVLAAGPLALMSMSLMGYHYTAIRLAMHLHTTFITLIGLLLLSCLIRRWLLLSRRQIVVSQARQRLEDARRRDPIAATAGSNASLSAIDSRTDLAQINAQTIRLVRSTLVFAAIAAVAFIWSSVLPAVGVLESITLWPVEGGTPITLAHMLVAIPTIIMTVVAARNLPGLMEIALLQHLPLENAVRYAISSLSRYTILILGIAMTFNSIGVRWASIQWLVAALGVGLGFGLQEIFANFVSGLILLFEQPIRVGDVITLGDTTGSVSRIRMRATTVTNFDQQELIIPNKDLITGRLLNWTLTDSTNRMIIQVGVSYDSDPDLACALLREACAQHPNVLKEPGPTAFFEHFGDSTLDLKARFYLANLDQRLPTKHDIHLQIKKKFAEAGIEISFPQRDLHIRSMPRELASVLTSEEYERKLGERDTPLPEKKHNESSVANPIPTVVPTNYKKNGFVQGE